MEEILSYSFVQRAILAAILSGISCGLIGTYMVTRKLLFLGGGITHSSLGGIGLAYFAGFSTTLGALIFAIMSALGIEHLTSRARSGRLKISEDSATSVVWSAGMALGVIFIFLTPGYAPNLMSYLFGSLLLTTTEQLLYLAAFNVAVIALYALLGRAILFMSLDKEYAASQGLPVRLLNTIMLMVLAIGIVVNIRILGIMLMLSMLTIPVLIARVFSQRYYKIVALSSIIATICALCGLLFSYLYDIPSSAVSIASLLILLIASISIRRLTMAKGSRS